MGIGSWLCLGLVCMLVWFSCSTIRLAKRYAELVRENERSWNTSRAVAISPEEETAFICSSLLLFPLARVVLRRMKAMAEHMPEEDDFLDYAKSIRFLCIMVSVVCIIRAVQHEMGGG